MVYMVQVSPKKTRVERSNEILRYRLFVVDLYFLRKLRVLC
jgi:hypothetical protein